MDIGFSGLLHLLVLPEFNPAGVALVTTFR